MLCGVHRGSMFIIRGWLCIAFSDIFLHKNYKLGCRGAWCLQRLTCRRWNAASKQSATSSRLGGLCKFSPAVIKLCLVLLLQGRLVSASMLSVRVLFTVFCGWHVFIPAWFLVRVVFACLGSVCLSLPVLSCFSFVLTTHSPTVASTHAGWHHCFTHRDGFCWSLLRLCLSLLVLGFLHILHHGS